MFQRDSKKLENCQFKVISPDISPFLCTVVFNHLFHVLLIPSDKHTTFPFLAVLNDIQNAFY